MRYPKELVRRYKEFIEEEKKLNELKVDQLQADIREEADIYAAEIGADRDGSYDASDLFDELDEQLEDY